MIGLPHPTHKLIARIAALKGQSMTDAMYLIFRDELARLETGDAWASAPAPFSIKPTYTDKGCEVLLWHPATPTVILNRKEASAIAEAIHLAVEGVQTVFGLRTETGDVNVRVIHSGRSILLSVNGDHATMILPAATDVADALISASVHAGPLPEGGPN